MSKRRLLVLALFVLVGAAVTLAYVYRGYIAPFAPPALAGGEQLDSIVLPDGFSIDVYAEGVEGARSLSVGPDGIVFVGSRSAGNVYALVDADGDHRAERVVTVASGLRSPNGVAFRDGSLFVAEISRVLRYDDIVEKLDDPPRPTVVRDDLPTEGHHGWKFIRFGPDGNLYVPVGAPCNVCLREDDERFASILRMSTDGTELSVFAHGVRNSVGFDWNPADDVLWFTDNGRDWMGDDAPPDELNRAAEAGLHFGFPYCHGGTIADPEHGGRRCDELRGPEATLQPHGAALGMRFYDADQFPSRYRGGIFFAQHGSWNRSSPVGYRVSFISIENGHAGEPEVFADGWLQTPAAWGRPVDVSVLPDGSLLVSDDKAGLVYRISYAGEGTTPS